MLPQRRCDNYHSHRRDNTGMRATALLLASRPLVFEETLLLQERSTDVLRRSKAAGAR